MPGGVMVVNSSNVKDSYAMARAPPRSFLVKLLRPLLLFGVFTTGFLVAAFLLFLSGSGAASSYYRVRSLAVPDVLLAAGRSAPRAEENEVERWWARPPAKSAWHNMSDEELLWAASFEPRAAPPRRPLKPRKVAFLFLSPDARPAVAGAALTVGKNVAIV